MWTKYTEAMEKGMTGSPKVGDEVVFKVKKNAPNYRGVVSKVLSPRKYMIKYKVPTEMRSHFVDGTSTAIANIENMLFFNAVLHESKDEESDEK